MYPQLGHVPSTNRSAKNLEKNQLSKERVLDWFTFDLLHNIVVLFLDASAKVHFVLLEKAIHFSEGFCRHLGLY